TALAWPMTAMLAAAWRFGTTVEFSAGRSASARHRISDRLYVSSRPVERKQYVSNSASSVGQMPFTGESSVITGVVGELAPAQNDETAPPRLCPTSTMDVEPALWPSSVRPSATICPMAAEDS